MVVCEIRHRFTNGKTRIVGSITQVGRRDHVYESAAYIVQVKRE